MQTHLTEKIDSIARSKLTRFPFVKKVNTIMATFSVTEKKKNKDNDSGDKNSPFDKKYSFRPLDTERCFPVLLTTAASKKMMNWIRENTSKQQPFLLLWFMFSKHLLAEVSHGEANKRRERDLCRLPTRFLSRMRWRFLNNH